jgi:aspartate racemase
MSVYQQQNLQQQTFHQRTLGIIGGMSWESTQSYYRLINQGVKEKLGGHHSADLLIHSVDFAQINELQEQGEWDELGVIMASSGTRLQAAEAQGLLPCIRWSIR